MSLYEYRCEECTRECEVLVKKAHKKIVCPHCGSERLTKLLSAFATTQSSDTSCGMESSYPSAPCCGEKCAGKH